MWPAEVPTGLTSDDFAKLNGAWAEWSEGAAQAVEQLYAEHASVADLEAAIKKADIKLGTMRTALADPQYAELHGQLADLSGRLLRRLDVAKAILAAQRLDAEAGGLERIDKAFAQLGQALSRLDADLQSFANGAAWRPYVHFDELQALANDKGSSPELFATVRRSLAGRSTLEDPALREFLSRPSFLELEAALDAVEQAVAVRTNAEYVAELNKIAARLVEALETYETRGDGESAEKVRTEYLAWRGLAVDGGEGLSVVMRAHYFNFNFRIQVTEQFFKRAIDDVRSEGTWINERIMEADVTGFSCTNARITVDVKPCSERARFVIVLNGQVRTNTEAQTHIANVQSLGNHCFRAEKPIEFDGHEFCTGRARVSVRPNTCTVDASTTCSWLPILGRFADNLAFEEAQSRTPEANGLAVQKISQQVGPRLDREVGSQFDEASTQLEAKVYGPLRELESYPQELRVSSTESDVAIRARLMESVELGGGEPPTFIPPPADGLLIQIHESLLSNALERADLAGRELTQKELEDLLRERMEKLLGRKLEMDKPAEPEASPEAEGEQPQPEAGDADDMVDENGVFLFDTRDAIRFDVDGGVVRLVLRTGLKREGKDEIPPQIIEVPLSLKVEGDKIRVTREGTVAVRPVERVTNRTEQVVRANVMRANIQRLLPDRELEAVVDVEQAGKTMTLRVTDIVARDGWLSVSAR